MKAGQGNGRGLKLVGCLCFLLLLVALLLIDRHSPATGYELSIYNSLPALVWICLIGALAGATGMIVHQAFAGDKSGYWLLGFWTLAFALSIILLLPVFRGYALYGAMDSITHTRWAKELVADGHFERENQYPITHILMAQLAQATGSRPDAVTKYVPVLLTVLFMIFSYLLSSCVAPDRGPALLSAATTALFFNYYHVCTYPQTLSIMALPLVFYLYFKVLRGGGLPLRVAFVLVLLLFPYFHPAPAAVLIACLLAAEGAKALWRLRGGPTDPLPDQQIDRIALGPTLICSVAFLTWISSHAIFDRTILNTLGWLRGQLETIPRVVEVENLLQRQGLGIADQAVLAFKLYGDSFLLLGLSLAALLIIAWRFLQRRREVRNLSILSMAFLVSGPVWVLIFATTLMVTLGRLLGSNTMMWATPVFAAFALFEVFGRWKRAGVMTVTCILLLAALLGVFGVYHSPYTLQTSWQITRQDAYGSDWFVANRALPIERGFVNLGAASLLPGRLTVPEHFGYRQHQTLAEALQLPSELDSYMLVTEGFKLASADDSLPRGMISPWAQIELTQRDFEQLEEDRTVSKLYSNGELDVLRVIGENSGR